MEGVGRKSPYKIRLTFPKFRNFPTKLLLGLFPLIDSFQFDPGYVTIFVTIIGTTIAPWMQFYMQSAVIEKGIKIEDYKFALWDVIIGCTATVVVAFFIMVACAATYEDPHERAHALASLDELPRHVAPDEACRTRDQCCFVHWRMGSTPRPASVPEATPEGPAPWLPLPSPFDGWMRAGRSGLRVPGTICHFNIFQPSPSR